MSLFRLRCLQSLTAWVYDDYSRTFVPDFQWFVFWCDGGNGVMNLMAVLTSPEDRLTFVFIFSLPSIGVLSTTEPAANSPSKRVPTRLRLLFSRGILCMLFYSRWVFCVLRSLVTYLHLRLICPPFPLYIFCSFFFVASLCMLSNTCQPHVLILSAWPHVSMSSSHCRLLFTL